MRVYEKMKAAIIDLSGALDESLAFAGYVGSVSGSKDSEKGSNLYLATTPNRTREQMLLQNNDIPKTVDLAPGSVTDSNQFTRICLT